MWFVCLKKETGLDLTQEIADCNMNTKQNRLSYVDSREEGWPIRQRTKHTGLNDSNFLLTGVERFSSRREDASIWVPPTKGLRQTRSHNSKPSLDTCCWKGGYSWLVDYLLACQPSKSRKERYLVFLCGTTSTFCAYACSHYSYPPWGGCSSLNWSCLRLSYVKCSRQTNKTSA